MTEEDREYVYDCMINEGFDYCFDGYHNFKEIKDLAFHQYRRDYLEAKKKLENYINEQKTNKSRRRS